MTLSGESRSRIGLLNNLSIGPFSHTDLNCSRGGFNTLGMRYISRFLVTFDFPSGAIYLQKGRHFQALDPRGTSGIALKKINGRMVVVMVAVNCPAAEAGIQVGDELISINERKTTDLDLFEIGNTLMSEPGARIALGVLRGGEELRILLVTKSRLELPRPPNPQNVTVPAQTKP
jgi:predicted metalloprotease with PDZ domain